MSIDLACPGQQVLQTALEYAKKICGHNLHSAYALGSLAHGGFSSLVSDVDLALVFCDASDQNDVIVEIQDTVVSSKLPLADRLSIFWADYHSLKSGTKVGRFPLLDRMDLITHGKLLAGTSLKEDVLCPTIREALIDSVIFCFEKLWTQDIITMIKNAEKLIEKDIRYMTKIILFPARLLYTVHSGKLGKNESSVDYYIKKYKHVELVKLAYQYRTDPKINKNLLKIYHYQLAPMYDEMLAVYSRLMRDYNQNDYADKLEKWRCDIQ